MRALLPLVLLAACRAPLDAGAHPVAVTVYWENDSRVLKPNNDTDRWYTQGAGLEIRHEPAWAEALAEAIPLAPDDARTGAGYVLGQRIYTPRDLRDVLLREDDRPYAGHLFAGAYWQRAGEDVHDHLELDLGFVGEESFGEDVQQIVHEWMDGIRPRGWDHQLEDEWTIQAYARRTWKARLAEGFEVLPHAGLALGTVNRDLEAGVLLRAGFGLPDDFGPERFGRWGDATARDSARSSVYVFGSAAGRLVEHDLFLEGNTFRDSHSVDAEPFVGEVALGVALQFATERLRFRLSYAQIFRSREFEGQPHSHSWGSLALTLAWWF